jgi:hypothetical protein
MAWWGMGGDGAGAGHCGWGGCRATPVGLCLGSLLLTNLSTMFGGYPNPSKSLVDTPEQKRIHQRGQIEVLLVIILRIFGGYTYPSKYFPS